MTHEQIIQALDDIDLIEKDIMRDLTNEEKNLLIEKGWAALFKELHLNDFSFKILKEMRNILSVLFTKPDEEYLKLIENTDSEIGEVFKRIGEDIIRATTSDPADSIKTIIERLKTGETLELEPDIIDQVVDRLWRTEENVRIEVRNNKIRLR